MKRKLSKLIGCLGLLALAHSESSAQISLLQDYKNNTSATIGTFQGINYRESGFSALYSIPGTNGKEFWICSDRGVNIDCANANPATCRPTYDKMYAFAGYAPKIHRVRISGDSVQIMQTITIKRPSGTGATGVLNPTDLGSTATEKASTDTVLNCANFDLKTAAKDTFAIDAEAIAVDRDGFFWIAEEGGPTIWKLNGNGVVVKRYTPYANLGGAQSIDVAIDTAFKYRKNNRGFENMTIAPNGKIYAIIQSPLLYPTATVGNATYIHRMIEIDPVTNATRMLVYLNDGIINTGANQIRLQDWKLGDMTAINDSTFLVLEAAARGTTDIKRLYKININSATTVNSGLYGGLTVEALIDSAGLAGKGIVPVKKTLVMDLLANGWPSTLDKAEGITIINDSTIAICNDNDYGQTCPLANGLAIATTNVGHVITFRLQGVNKLTNFRRPVTTFAQGITGPTTNSAPYLVPTVPNGQVTSIITAGESAPNGYKMCGTPDGLGAFDNNDGTFTLLMNHEFGNTAGGVRAFGATGAFVSKWVINKSTLAVVSGSDLTQRVKLWNPVTSSYTTYNAQFPSTLTAMNRFCSADLPAVSAFYNSTTGKGTQARIFMNGEEAGNEGRGMAHIVTGPEAGTSYELPYLGKFSWENALASPRMSDTTVVAGLDDATPGQVYFYVGTKTNAGTEIEKAGLTGGKVYSVAVNNLLSETNATVPAPNTPFTMVDLGQVQNMTGVTLNTNSNNAGVTTFLRPEDGNWDPNNPSDFYFATTNAFNANSRLWRLRFTNPANVTQGGTITAVLDGTEGQQMLDNMTIDNSGHIILVEDVGGNAHVGRVWQYTIATDSFKVIATHDSTRFYNTASSYYLTQDEEASGQIDVQSILGPGMFLFSDQAHYGIAGEVVEGGQLMALYNPATALSNPEITVQGNSVTITSGTTAVSAANNTDFGGINVGQNTTKTFVIQNAGPGALPVTAVNITGANAGEFTLVTPTLPFTVAAGATQTLTVRFAPTATGARNAGLSILSNDLDESNYMFSIQGLGTVPEINLQGNSNNIANGDLTPGTVNGTDFGTVNLSANATRTYTVQNTGSGPLTITGATIAGANAADFTITAPTAFPVTVAANATTVLTIQFAPAAAGIRSALLNIANDDADEAAYQFALQGIGRDATGIGTLSASSFAKLYPNPTGEAATVAITLKKGEHVIVSVLNLEGKEVLRAADQNFNSGEQQIALNTANLASGTYFVEIATGSQVTKMKMVVAH